MMLWKCCTQYVSKFGKHSSGHRPGKGQFSFQSQRKATPKNVQTTTQLHSFHMLAKEFSNSFNCFIDSTKAFDCGVHNKQSKFFKEMGIPDHLSCLPGNLHAGKEAIVRTGCGTMDWFQIGKGVHQGFILPPCLFNFYASERGEWKSWFKTQHSEI